MKKLLFQLITILVSTLLISSCTSTKKVQEHLEYHKQPIAYLMDSPPVENKSAYQVSISSIQIDSSIRSNSLAVKETGWMVPLLFANFWASRKMCYQGASMFEESWSASFRKNLIKEGNRSGVFTIDSSTTGGSYQLELSIDQLEAKGPYFSKGFYIFAVFFYVSSFGDYAGPAKTKLAVSYRLKEDGKLIHENAFSAEKETEQLKKGYKNKKELIQGFATSMAEATSYNFKNIIESVVLDLNAYFEKELE